MPPKHTALGEISQAIVNLENNPFPANLTYSKQLFENIGPVMDTLKKSVFANMWLTAPLVENILSASRTTNGTIRTTTAATMAKGSSKDNILPTEASATVNFRIMPGETINSVMHYVTEVVDNPNVKIEKMTGFGNNPSSVSLSNNDNFQRLKQSIYRVTQDKSMIVTPYLVMGGTDAKHYSELSNSIYRFAFNRFKPKTLGQMHGINEQIKVDDYIDTIKFFRELILSSDRN
jgi:carboxypeptidase PM20D1